MVQNDWSSPSGSRWEPVPPGGLAPLAKRAAAGPRRRYRRPVIAVLLTLLGAGAVTGGAAYAQGDGTGASTPPSAGSHVAGSGDQGGRHTHERHGSSS